MVTALNMQGASLSSTYLDNKLRALLTQQDDRWSSSSVILLQEAFDTRYRGIDVQLHRARLELTKTRGVGVLTGSDWRVHSVFAPLQSDNKSYFLEACAAHKQLGTHVFISVHLPSSTAAHPVLAAEIGNQLVGRLKRWRQRVQAVVIGGDWNEVLRHTERSGPHSQPIVLPMPTPPHPLCSAGRGCDTLLSSAGQDLNIQASRTYGTACPGITMAALRP